MGQKLSIINIEVGHDAWIKGICVFMIDVGLG